MIRIRHAHNLVERMYEREVAGRVYRKNLQLASTSRFRSHWPGWKPERSPA